MEENHDVLVGWLLCLYLNQFVPCIWWFIYTNIFKKSSWKRNVNLSRVAQMWTNLYTLVWMWSHLFICMDKNYFCIQLYQSAQICGNVKLLLPCQKCIANIRTRKLEFGCKCVVIKIHANNLPLKANFL